MSGLQLLPVRHAIQESCKPAASPATKVESSIKSVTNSLKSTRMQKTILKGVVPDAKEMRFSSTSTLIDLSFVVSTHTEIYLEEIILWPLPKKKKEKRKKKNFYLFRLERGGAGNNTFLERRF
jgi:hypothetical protein